MDLPGDARLDQPYGRTDLADRIRDGDVAVDFLRPVDVQGAFVATEVGRSLFAFLPRGLPTLAIGVVVIGVPWPGGPALALGLVSLLLAVTVSATTVYLVATAGFWLVETRGLQVLYMVLSGFFAGLFLPIWFFPDWLLVLVTLTPFPSMMMYPTDILAGRVDVGGALLHLALQTRWLAVTIAVGQVLTRPAGTAWRCRADDHPHRARRPLPRRRRLPAPLPAQPPRELPARPGEQPADRAGRAGRGDGALPPGGPDRRPRPRGGALVFALAETGFSLADMVVGHCDTIPTYLRAGTLDVFYLRPQPLLLQLITSDLQLRRLSRAGFGAVVLVVAVWVNDLTFDLRTVALLGLALVSATLTFAAMFVWAAGVQFFLVDGAETTNAFVYGGRYAATQPASVWGRPLLVVFGFAFPMAFTAFLPVVTLLGLDTGDLLGLPSWSGWAAPLAAVWAWCLAAVSWRLGVRHYQGGGG